MFNFFNLDVLPCAVGYKNKNSVYTFGNKVLANYMGYQSADEVVGLTDADVKNDMHLLTEDFQRQDKEVLELGQQQHIDVGYYNQGDLQIHLSTKKPVYDNHELVGTVYTCFELENSFLKKLYLNMAKIKLPVFIELGGQYEKFDLSMRESETLFYLIRGYTAKEIGCELNVSQKTIEVYVDRLKRKLNCQNRSALIEKAIDLGFLFNLPKSVLC